MRVIFSLEIQIDEHGLAFLIANLDPSGNSPTIKPLTKKRCIDLRIGDEFQHASTVYKVQDIKAYRETREWHGEAPDDGYLLR